MTQTTFSKRTILKPEKFGGSRQRTRRWMGPLLVVWCALFGGGCLAAGAVKSVDIYVLPYYQSAASAKEMPLVAVSKDHDLLLSSSDPYDILTVAKAVESKPGLITPMTLMVLAIRLYDVGLKDDSVFWFYVAKERLITASQVLDFNSPLLNQARAATISFAQLAGPTINGYAFCDVEKQSKIRWKAAQWGIDHPYEVVFMPNMPALPGDRAANLESANNKAMAIALKETEALNDPKLLEALKAGRKASSADEKYCW